MSGSFDYASDDHSIYRFDSQYLGSHTISVDLEQYLPDVCENIKDGEIFNVENLKLGAGPFAIEASLSWFATLKNLKQDNNSQLQLVHFSKGSLLDTDCLFYLMEFTGIKAGILLRRVCKDWNKKITVNHSCWNNFYGKTVLTLEKIPDSISTLKTVHEKVCFFMNRFPIPFPLTSGIFTGRMFDRNFKQEREKMAILKFPEAPANPSVKIFHAALAVALLSSNKFFPLPSDEFFLGNSQSNSKQSLAKIIYPFVKSLFGEVDKDAQFKIDQACHKFDKPPVDEYNPQSYNEYLPPQQQPFIQQPFIQQPMINEYAPPQQQPPQQQPLPVQQPTSFLQGISDTISGFFHSTSDKEEAAPIQVLLPIPSLPSPPQQQQQQPVRMIKLMDEMGEYEVPEQVPEFDARTMLPFIQQPVSIPFNQGPVHAPPQVTTYSWVGDNSPPCYAPISSFVVTETPYQAVEHKALQTFEVGVCPRLTGEEKTFEPFIFLDAIESCAFGRLTNDEQDKVKDLFEKINCNKQDIIVYKYKSQKGRGFARKFFNAGGYYDEFDTFAVYHVQEKGIFLVLNASETCFIV